jgi:phosphate-selective porin OprO/OprP
MRAARAALASLLLAAPVFAEAGPEAEAADARAVYFDVGWDDGPTYEYGHRLPALAEMPWAEPARQLRLRGRLGASLSLDGGVLGGDTLSDGPRFDVRRARFLTRGDVYWLLLIDYKLEFAVEDQSVYLNDFFLRWRPPRYVDYVRFGYFDPPISLAALTGNADRSLMENGAPVSAFAPGFRLGVDTAAHYAKPSLTWQASLTSVGQSQPNTDATSASVLRAAGRLAWRPFGEDVGFRVVHLGLSASHVLSGSADVRYRARPDTFLTPYLVDTGDFDADTTLVGLEAAWRRGMVSIQSEYLHAFVDADEGGLLAFYGGYAELAIALTGETRPYDVASSTFGRLEPLRPYKPLRGRWGAVELAARGSWLDLTDHPVDGGRMAALSFGPTWTWNRFVRFMAGYVYAHVDDRPGGGHAHVAQARLELRI